MSEKYYSNLIAKVKEVRRICQTVLLINPNSELAKAILEELSDDTPISE